SASQTLTVRSTPPLASRLPSGDHATLLTSPACPFSASDCFPVPASQILAVPSADAVARSLPSGDQDTLLTGPSWPVRQSTCCPPASAQTPAGPSSGAPARRLPPGPQARLLTARAGRNQRRSLLRVRVARPDSGSQTVTLPSAEELARR